MCGGRASGGEVCLVVCEEAGDGESEGFSRGELDGEEGARGCAAGGSNGASAEMGLDAGLVESKGASFRLFCDEAVAAVGCSAPRAAPEKKGGCR